MAFNNWFFDKADFKRTPSIMDGISYETEQRYRREGARFINKVGTKMNLRYDTMATGVVYFHRFYMCHSFKQFPRYITACCCLFLAGKVEETPKKCKDIIKNAKYFITDSQFSKFGDDPKEEVLTLERILLQTINFDLQVDHPYGYLLKYAKILKGDQEKLQKMVQMAWTFINDSMCTTISLQWEPEVIAIALMFLAGKLTKFDVLDWEGKTSNQSKWWDMYVEDISTELLEDICHQVLDLYSMPMPESPKDSPIYESPKHNPTYPDIQLNPASNPALINSVPQQNMKLTGPIGNLPIPTNPTSYPILPPTNLPPQQQNMTTGPLTIVPPNLPPPHIPPNQFSNYKSIPPILPPIPTGPPIPNDYNAPFYPRPPTNNGHPFSNIN